MIAWSWSRIETFEQCPRKFQLQNILKPENFKFVENDIMRRGKAVHAMLEDELLRAPLHPEHKQYENILQDVEPIISNIRKQFKDIQCERDVAFDKDLNEVSWFAKNTMFRAQLDVLAVSGSKAIIYDWKTGKVKDKPDQLRLYAAVVFLLYPKVETVHTAFIFVDHKQVRDAMYKREQFQEIWKEFGERSELIQIANDNSDFPPRKNNLCGWCEALPDQCPYSKKVRK